MDIKNIFDAKWFDVVDVEGTMAIRPKSMNIIVMPFERDDNGLPSRIGVLEEFNPIRSGMYSRTLVTGDAEGDDPDLLSVAKRELTEETGYNVAETERWFYLGLMTTGKLVMGEHPCFAVDVTGIRPGQIEGDGSTNEKRSRFEMMSVKDALDTDDCHVPTLFLRVFKFVFGFDAVSPVNPGEEDKSKKSVVKDVKKDVNIEGDKEEKENVKGKEAVNMKNPIQDAGGDKE